MLVMRVRRFHSLRRASESEGMSMSQEMATPETPQSRTRPLPLADDALLQNVRVASPCTVSWEAMPGSDQVRSCEQCHHKVYNLSAMSAADAAQLLRNAEGRVCVRFYRRADGTIMTRDCPVGLRAVRQRVARATTMAFSTVLVAFGGVSMASRPRSEQPRLIRWVLNAINPEPVREPVMGDMVAVPSPAYRELPMAPSPPETVMGKRVISREMGEVVLGSPNVEPFSMRPEGNEEEPEFVVSRTGGTLTMGQATIRLNKQEEESLPMGSSFSAEVEEEDGRFDSAPPFPNTSKPFLTMKPCYPPIPREDPFAKVERKYEEAP
jgi:hypothetical protein